MSLLRDTLLVQVRTLARVHVIVYRLWVVVSCRKICKVRFVSDLRAIIDLLKSESGIARDWSSPARDASTRKHCLPVLQRVPLSRESRPHRIKI
jgi:hypothetical protein